MYFSVLLSLLCRFYNNLSFLHFIKKSMPVLNWLRVVKFRIKLAQKICASGGCTPILLGVASLVSEKLAYSPL